MSPPDPDDPDALYQEAHALYERSELDAAARGFQRVLTADAGHVQARYKLGNAFKELGRLEEAEAQYRAVLERSPRHAEALNNLGAICQAQDRHDAAAHCYRQAIDCKPGLAQPYLNLGRLLQGQARHQDAAKTYRRALEQGLDEGVFGHLLAAMEGNTTARAPASYVRETFDAFAAQFEHRVVDALGYQVPARLAALVRLNGGPGADILDLGCGTGLVGAALGPCRSLVGVDVSPRMLDEARRKACYTRLHAADIDEWLGRAQARSFDLAVAADVFIYIGALDAVFREVKRVLRPDGLFAFSVENGGATSFELRPTGRYAQSQSYIEGMAARFGMSLLAREPVQVRSGVAGELYLLRNAGVP